VLNARDGTGRYSRIQQVQGKRTVAQEVTQQVARDAAVGDRRDRPGPAGQVRQEGLQPRGPATSAELNFPGAVAVTARAA